MKVYIMMNKLVNIPKLSLRLNQLELCHSRDTCQWELGGPGMGRTSSCYNCKLRVALCTEGWSPQGEVAFKSGVDFQGRESKDVPML